jgi:hypothetical protein
MIAPPARAAQAHAIVATSNKRMRKTMDYSELLFAYHVRELAMKRLVHETPEGLTAEAATQYMFERYEPTVIGVVRELQNVATMIRKAAPEAAAQDASIR